MFGSLGFTEIAFILVLALLLFGPKRLPEIGRTIGKGLGEFRRASNDLRRTLENEVALDEVEEKRRSRPAAVKPAATEPAGREGDEQRPPGGETEPPGDGEVRAPGARPASRTVERAD